jgi:NADPH:quinone reductase-like Zn-dependent oxidoreductase
MKALRFARTGDLSHLALADEPRPAPDGGEILVRVRAAGLNKSDVSNVMGGHRYTTLPRTPGRDFAGIVEQGPPGLVGRGVWGTGKELGFTRDGSHAEYLVLPAEWAAIMPSRLSFAEAGSCGVPYVTAWHALENARVEKGTKLLVVGGAGAVGNAALHLGSLRGAEVLGAVRKPEQADLLRSRGFASVLLSEKQGLPPDMDVVFDTTGACLEPAIGALAVYGRVVVIVAPGEGRTSVPLRELYRRGASLVGVNSLLYSAAECARLLGELAPHFDSGRLRPPARIEERALAPDAYALLKQGHAGKIVFTP